MCIECGKQKLVEYSALPYATRQEVVRQLQKGRAKNVVAREFGVRLWTVHKAVFDLRSNGVFVPSTSKLAARA